MSLGRSDLPTVYRKIVYFGARQSGKTSNLRSLFSQTSEKVQAGTHRFLETELKSPFFECIPISLGAIQDQHVVLHLYTCSFDCPFESVRKFLFTGLHGFVFVVDASLERLLANQEAFQLLKFHLREEAYLFADIPHVIQFNKVDKKSTLPLNTLSKLFNPHDAPEQEAVAKDAEGTLETLTLLTKQIVTRLVSTEALVVPEFQERSRKRELEF